MQTQVLIVGGGPVGLGLAVDLAMRDIQSVVVERKTEPSPIPKGQNLTGRTVEHFHFWDAADALRAERVQPEGFGASGVTTYASLTSGYHYDWLSRHWVRPYYFQGNERVPQYGTERVLRRRAIELPQVTARFGDSVVAVEQQPGYASATVQSTDGAESEVKADYLVACDGAHSRVVAQSGIPVTRTDHDKRMVLLVFKSVELHELLQQRFPGVSFFNVLHPDYDGYWLFFGRVDITTFFFHAPVPVDTERNNFDFEGFVQRAAGAEFSLEIEHIGFWDLRISQADAYQSGRIFVAGDAAHSHPPYGGYGINTGFEDIRNLGWKLSAQLKGWGGDALLSTYHEERHPVFRSTAEDFIDKAIVSDKTFLQQYSPLKDRAIFEAEWSKRGGGAQQEVDAFEPHYAGSSIVADDGAAADSAPSAVGAHRFEAVAGHHLAPLALHDNRNVYEALGRDFTLLVIGSGGTQATAMADVAARMKIPLRVVSEPMTDELARYQARYILVRPDHFVAWAGQEIPADAGLAVIKNAIAAANP